MILIVIRRSFGLQPKDQGALGLDEDDRAVLTRNTYPAVALLAGAAGSLARPLQKADLLKVAREDALATDYRIA